MMEMATVMGVTIGSDDVDAYFNQLGEYSVEIVVKAIDMAIHRRDPDDKFLEKTIITMPEILGAINEVNKPSEGQTGTVTSCKRCQGMGWLAAEDKKGHLIAWPCECLYKTAKETLAKKQRPTAKAEETRKCCRSIVTAYEHHQEKWGTK